MEERDLQPGDERESRLRTTARGWFAEHWRRYEEHRETARPAVGIAGLSALWGACVAIPAALAHVPAPSHARLASEGVSWLLPLASHRVEVATTACWITAICALVFVLVAAERTGYWQFIREGHSESTRILVGMGLASALAGAGLAPMTPWFLHASSVSVFREPIDLLATLLLSTPVIPMLLPAVGVYVAGSLRGVPRPTLLRLAGSTALLGALFQVTFLATAAVAFPVIVKGQFLQPAGHLAPVLSFVTQASLAGLGVGILLGRVTQVQALPGKA